MSTPAQVGKYEWRGAIKKANDANDRQRELLRKIIRQGGPLVQALAAEAALNVLDNENQLRRLEQIGRNTKR